MSTKKATKRALLTSILAICMCLVMLIGSTFAWFTDTASTSVNQIKSGNLKVAIVDEKGGTLEALNFVNVEDSADILWEPGATFLTQGFKIKNDGNLALKWKMEVNKDSAESGTVPGSTGKEEMNLLDVIDFSIVQSKNEGAPAVNLDTFEGKLPSGTSDTYYLKGTMKTTAGNNYQNLTLEKITVTVYATQLNYENDSYGPDYDKNAGYPVKVSTAEEFKAALEAGNSVDLQQDIELVDEVTVSGVTKLELNDKTVTDKTENGMNVTGTLIVDDSAGGQVVLAGDNGSINVAENATIVVNSGTVTAADSNKTYGLIYCSEGGTAVINGGEITSDYAPLSGNNTTGNMNFIINGGTITAKMGPAIYMPGQGELTITGGTLNGGISLRMGQVNISGGTINATTGRSVIIGFQKTQIYQRFSGSRQEVFILKFQNDENNAAQQDNGRRFHNRW